MSKRLNSISIGKDNDFCLAFQVHEQNLGYRVSETIDAHVAVNGRGPPRSGGRDRAKGP